MAYHHWRHHGFFGPNVAACFCELVKLETKLQADLLEREGGREGGRGSMGEGVLDVMQGHSCMTMHPRIPT